MPRYLLVWLVSVLLRLSGTLWFLFSLSMLIVNTAYLSGGEYAAPTSAEPFPGANDLTYALAGSLAFSYFSAYALNIFLGLIAIAVGQMLMIMVSVEENTRRRPARPAADPTLRDDLEQFRRRAVDR